MAGTDKFLEDLNKGWNSVLSLFTVNIGGAVADDLGELGDVIDTGNAVNVKEVEPPWTHNDAILQVDVTNETNATTNRRFSVRDYDTLTVQFEKTGGTDTVTLTVLATAQRDGTAIGSKLFQDISQYGVETLSQAAGAANYTADVFLRIPCRGIDAITLTTVSAGGGNDADYSIYAVRF